MSQLRARAGRCVCACTKRGQSAGGCVRVECGGEGRVLNAGVRVYACVSKVRAKVRAKVYVWSEGEVCAWTLKVGVEGRLSVKTRRKYNKCHIP